MNELRLPVYAKISLILLGLVIIFYGQNIIVPLSFAMLLAVLLLPLCRFLERLKFPRPLAIMVCILVAVILVSLIIYFISSQIMTFTEAAPDLKGKLAKHLHDLHTWMENTFGVSNTKQSKWTDEKLNQFYAMSGTYLAGTLTAVTGVLIFVGLIPVYVVLFLYYRNHLIDFIVKVFGHEEKPRVREILKETREVIQSYISGLLIEAAIVATLNSIGLLIVGLPYAILIGVIAAILNIVPYVGGLIAILLAVSMAVISHDSLLYPLLVTGVLLLVQFIDNNVLVPRVVASKVSLNALMSIIAVLIGGALCGIWGMFLSIPFTAILKIVFDRVESMKPWGMLLGNSQADDKKRKNNP
jgi:predicted PurR-regulated permease PerM